VVSITIAFLVSVTVVQLHIDYKSDFVKSSKERAEERRNFMNNVQMPGNLGGIGGARRPMQLTMPTGANPVNAFAPGGLVGQMPAAGSISANTAEAFHQFNLRYGRLYAFIMGTAPSVSYTLKKVFDKDAEGKKIPLNAATQKAATEAEAKKAAGEGGAAPKAEETKSKVKTQYKYHRELILKEGAPTKRKGAIIGIPKGSFETKGSVTSMVRSGDYSFNEDSTDLVVTVLDNELLTSVMQNVFGNKIREADEINGGRPALLGFGWKLPKGKTPGTATMEEKSKTRAAGMQFCIHAHSESVRKNLLTEDNFIPLYSATVSNSNKITRNDETRKEALYAIEQVVSKAEESVRASLDTLITMNNGLVTDSTILNGNTSVTKDVKTFTGEPKRDVRLPLKKKTMNKKGKYTYKTDKTGHLIGEQFGPDKDPRYSSLLKRFFPTPEAYDKAIETMKGLAKTGARKSKKGSDNQQYFTEADLNLFDSQDASNMMESLEALFSNSMYN